jgi:hypothetical protein
MEDSLGVSRDEAKQDSKSEQDHSLIESARASVGYTIGTDGVPLPERGVPAKPFRSHINSPPLKQLFGRRQKQLAHAEVIEDEQRYRNHRLQILLAGAVESRFIEQDMRFACRERKLYSQ